MQALGAAQNGRQGLQGDPDNIVLRLLGGQGAAGCLAVEAQPPALGVFGPKPFLHDFGPQAAGGPVLGYYYTES
jgi:hypothetical protein